ncbi:hypothetical protein C2845_PM15G00490 [Panicum miliaceum]|uniref:F-box domain-containing protein n=1 Tax=Panicum miliaceum TaxID=4540 RepID=A0A3L6QBW7_PANMI|nr:hypothetical protein C2845_PM15G00490 [Panicum miliaceum]
MEIGVATLPDDALADILRRLPAGTLATARAVCRVWRSIIDARELLLPHSVHGIFINYSGHRRPHLFACGPSSTSSTSLTIDGMLSFMPNDRRDLWSVMDHCRGLLLCSINDRIDLCVCNPATRRWTLLPRQTKRLWSDETPHHAFAYLAFDPQVSPHYEVFLVPAVPKKPSPPDRWNETTLVAEETEEDLEQVPSVDEDPCLLMEWPPSQWAVNVFSSRTGRWEERAFVREGNPAGLVKEDAVGSTNTDMVWATQALCRVLAWSALRGFLCLVWILSESSGKMEWVLKYQDDLLPQAQYISSFDNNGELADGPWMVEEDSSGMHDSDDSSETVTSEIFEWDSDNADFLSFEVGASADNTKETLAQQNFDWHSVNDEDGDEEYCSSGIFDILGFHPYKEVVFLVEPFGAAAYDLNSSKIRYLGNSRPKCYDQSQSNGIFESFVYTPCMIGELQREAFLARVHLND